MKLYRIIPAVIIAAALTACTEAPAVTAQTSASTAATSATTVTTAATTTAATTEEVFIKDDYVTAPMAICAEVGGRTVYTKNAETTVDPGAMTKLMTAVIACGYPELTFNVGGEVGLIAEGSSVAQLRAGQRLDLNGILTALLVAGGNDAAYTVAVNVAREQGGELSDSQAVSAFVASMNALAGELGMNATRFVNPDGCPDDAATATLADMALLAQRAAELDAITAVTSQKTASVTYLTGEKATWESKNPLLSVESELFLPLGLIRGYTPDGGYLLCALARGTDDKEYLTVTAGSKEPDNLSAEAKKLITLAIKGYQGDVVEAYTAVECLDTQAAA